MKYSSETHRILKTMYKTGGISKNQLPPSELKRLFQDNYITNSTDFHDDTVYLTDAGRAYIEEVKSDDKRYKEEKRRSWIQFWILLIVSNLIVLIGAYRQELVAIIRVITKLLK